MYHDVEREPLPFFLREIELKKLSGHLFVTAKDFQISLNFMAGKLANGMSTRFDEKLSVILHVMGGINEEQYNFLSGLNQFSDDQVAGILLDQNFAKKKDIYYARIYQLRRIAISTFALQQGKWIFTAGEPDPPLREAFEIPLAGILVEGARAIDHVSVYANKWLHSTPVLFSEIPMADEIYFTDAERDFYASVQRQGSLNCRELIARLNMIPLEFWRNMLAFHLLGIIEFEKGEALPDVSAEIAALLDLHEKMQSAPAAGREWLGLPPGAPLAAVEKAKADLLARFAPERFGPAAAPEIKRIARSVCQNLRALAAAPEAMPDIAARPGPPRAEDLVVELEGPVGPQLLGEADRVLEPEEQDEPELLSAEEMIVEAEVRSEPEPPVHPDLVVEPVIEIEMEPEEKVRPRAGTADSLSPPPLGAAPTAPPPSLRMVDADHEKAWELMLQAKELYEKHEYDKAVPLLKKAIRLVPRQGDFYYLLGLCQSEVEIFRNEAEINLKKAIELKSWSADPVYALGVLYRGQGKMKLAERCFQRVKEIAYEHTGASRALVDLRRRKAGVPGRSAPSKKKLF